MRYVLPVRGEGVYWSDTHWDSNGNGQPDLAVDIFAPAGTPIWACTAGYAEARTYPNGGYTVTLYGDDGRVYYHAHLKQPGVSGRVELDAFLGRVGQTGNAVNTPPHCHWAVGTRAYGIDAYGQGDIAPWPLLRAWQAQQPVPEEDPVRIAELEAENARLINLLGVVRGDYADALEASILDLERTRLTVPQRGAVQDGLRPVLNTLRTVGA